MPTKHTFLCDLTGVAFGRLMVAGFVASVAQCKRSKAERYVISNCPYYTQKRKARQNRKEKSVQTKHTFLCDLKDVAFGRLMVAGFVASVAQGKRSKAERYVISNCPYYTQKKEGTAKQEKRKKCANKAHFSLRPKGRRLPYG